MALAVLKARYCYRSFANYDAARVITYMDRQYTHALVLDAKTDRRDTGCVSHVVRFFEMIEINDAKQASCSSHRYQGRIQTTDVQCEVMLKRDFFGSSLFTAMFVCDKFLPEDFCWGFVAEAFARRIVEAMTDEYEISVTQR